MATGDKLFTIQSVSLQQDVANGLKIQSSHAYDVDTTIGTLTYHATVAGQVSDLQARARQLAGHRREPFAKITVTNSQYVDAHYLLSPARLRPDDEGRQGHHSAAQQHRLPAP